MTHTKYLDKINTFYRNKHINETQYFACVPELAWNFYIGGYQLEQKWIKASKLDYEDIVHYQKIIVALTETDRIIKWIDKVLNFNI